MFKHSVVIHNSYIGNLFYITVSVQISIYIFAGTDYAFRLKYTTHCIAFAPCLMCCCLLIDDIQEACTEDNAVGVYLATDE